VHHSAVIALEIATCSAVVAFLISSRARPATAARAITVLATICAASTSWALLLIFGANVVQLHGVAERISWCSNLSVAHTGTLGPIGVVAVVALAGILASALRMRKRQLVLRAPPGQSEIAILDSEAPTAYALPGKPGQIVISTGMLRSLDPHERRVLLAHERAHLRCHHHRYVRLTQISAAAIPMLAPLNARVRLATERWADEEAAREVGDRGVVALAIAHAAIVETEAVQGGLAMADTGVVQRIESLLNEGPKPSRVLELGLTGVIAGAVGGLVFSVVHIEPWIASLLGICH
jgi:Zn-dependent protease with chaperone function